MTPALWFSHHGCHVFPVNGKEPAVARGTSWKDWRGDVARLRDYAVALGVLAVIDSDVPATEAWVAAHLPLTPFTVTTGPYHDGSPGRGRHSYFRLVGDAQPFIRRDGHTIEFKRHGQYVVGPGSRHPSGVVYEATAWSWRWEDVPFFPGDDFVWDDRPLAARGSSSGQPLTLPDVVHEGERHAMLHRLMRSLAAHGVPLDGALTTCYAANGEKCRPPLEETDALKRFLRRAYQQKDRADFTRAPKTGWELAGALLELGLSVGATIVAVRSVTPDFDPEASA